MTNIIDKDKCLFYGMPGIAIMAISLIVSIRVGNDFGGNSLVVSISFFLCNLLLWMLYLVCFIYLPQDALSLWQGKAISQQTIKEAPSVDAVVESEAVVNDNSITQVSPSQEDITEPLAAPSCEITTERYQSHCQQFANRQLAELHKMMTEITKYVQYAMSPFVAEEDMPTLCKEIQNWCMDCRHKPQEIPLKYHQDTRDRAKTIDFKHFIWNIGVRLGFNNGYSTTICAQFVKALFRSALAEVEVYSLSKTLSANPNGGHITIDAPSPESNSFHYAQRSNLDTDTTEVKRQYA